MDVYVTRASYGTVVRVFVAEFGIRKFHGCVEFGDARTKSYCATWRGSERAMDLTLSNCDKLFGFKPPKGSAWECFYGRKPKRIDQDMDFSP